MKHACTEFRARLIKALRGRPCGSGTASFAWHEHIFACEECRDVLAAEEALEALLASLPEPRLPAGLAERLLRRLADARGDEDGLDELLLRGAASAEPPDLAGRVLSALVPARRAERALDRLLARVPAPPVPAALAERVLAGLAPLRGLRRPKRRRRAAAGLLVAAACVLVAVSVLVGRERRRARVEAEPAQDELLAALDVLENWELVTDDDVDLLLADLDALDELPELGTEPSAVGPWDAPAARPRRETEDGEGG